MGTNQMLSERFGHKTLEPNFNTRLITNGMWIKMTKLILASKSIARAKMLSDAGIEFEAVSSSIDEDAVKAALLSEGAKPQDIADRLADMKAARAALKYSDDLVLGSDQVLVLDGQIMSKATSLDAAIENLHKLQGHAHTLISAAVIYENGRPVWRSFSRAQLIMRPLNRTQIEAYVDDQQDAALHAVGGYFLEGKGAQLFTRVQGDYFTVLGMPLLDVLGFLRTRGIGLQ